MHTFRKLPKASPRAKITAARRGSTLAKCPVCLDLAIIFLVGTGLLRYEGDGTSGRVEVIVNKAGKLGAFTLLVASCVLILTGLPIELV